MTLRMPRRALAALAVVALLTTAGCAGLLQNAQTDSLNQGAGPASATQDGSAVHVTANGQAETDPNQAVVRVAVETSGDTAAVARQRLADNTSRMRQALLDLGLSEDQLTTVRYDLRQDYRRPQRKDGEPEREYRGFHMLEITLTDLDRVGDVVDTAVGNGATRVDGVRFTLTDETRRELKQEALQNAMTNAKSEATTVADAGDLELQKVDRIRTGESGGGYRRYMQTAVASAGGDGGTSFDAGPVTVTATVAVTYNASSV